MMELPVAWAPRAKTIQPKARSFVNILVGIYPAGKAGLQRQSSAATVFAVTLAENGFCPVTSFPSTAT